MTRYKRTLTAYEKKKVAARAKWHCEKCGEMLDESFEIDHIIPLHRGGEDTIENCQALHSKCHKEKTIREEIERIQTKQATYCEDRRAPLQCMNCQYILSPYFLHVCESIKKK